MVNGLRLRSGAESGLRKKAVVLLSILLISVSLGAISFSSSSSSNGESDRIAFPLNLTVYAPDDSLEQYAKVFVYRLAYDAETESNLEWTLICKGGRLSIPFSVEKKQFKYFKGTLKGVTNIYVTVNYRINVFGARGRGSLTMPIDPAEIEKTGKKDVVIKEMPYPGGITISQDSVDFSIMHLEESDETNEYTHVITYHSWDNMGSRFDADSGSKMRMKKRHRTSYFWPPDEVQNLGEWQDEGSTVVTVDAGRHWPSSGYKYGRYSYKVEFMLKYRYERYLTWIPEISGYLADEYSFAKDTASDPYGFKVTSGSPLSGNGEDDPWNHGNPDDGKYWSSQESLIDVPVHGHSGEGLMFSVSVGFGVQYPHGVGVSVSISVWKEYQAPSPMFVHVDVDTHEDPDMVGWCYDRNSRWMKLYLSWATEPP